MNLLHRSPDAPGRALLAVTLTYAAFAGKWVVPSGAFTEAYKNWCPFTKPPRGTQWSVRTAQPLAKTDSIPSRFGAAKKSTSHLV
jgi:hypothetical protein